MSLVDYNDTSDSENEADQYEKRKFIYSSNTTSQSRQFKTKTNKDRQKIKISIPSLEDFSDEEEVESPNQSKRKFSSSDLLSILPTPKQKPRLVTSFVPNVVNKNMRIQVNNSIAVSTYITPDSAHSSDEDAEVPETFNEEIWYEVCGKKGKEDTIVRRKESKTRPSPIDSQNNNIELAPEVVKPFVGLENQAFHDMVEQIKVQKSINLIDLYEDEVHPENDQWLKLLTDPKYETKTSIENPVNSTCRIKNHITALAQKALANDQELQMKWSENKHNRKQTREKYGF